MESNSGVYIHRPTECVYNFVQGFWWGFFSCALSGGKESTIASSVLQCQLQDLQGCCPQGYFHFSFLCAVRLVCRVLGHQGGISLSRRHPHQCMWMVTFYCKLSSRQCASGEIWSLEWNLAPCVQIELGVSLSNSFYLEASPKELKQPNVSVGVNHRFLGTALSKKMTF